MINKQKRTKNRETGDLGEQIAAKYLANKGYSVLERNYWRPWGEIDIVAQKKESIYFFEVKTALGDGSRETIRPEVNLHPEKLKRFDRVVQSYMWERRIPAKTSWALQAICVLLDMEGKTAKVEVIKDIS